MKKFCDSNISSFDLDIPKSTESEEDLKITFINVGITELSEKGKSSFWNNYNVNNKLEYMNIKFEFTNDEMKKNLKEFKGVYVFVVQKQFTLPNDFFKEVDLYNKIEGENGKLTFKPVYCIASDYKDRTIGDKTINEPLEEGNVFYCGKSDKIFDRIYDHLTNKKYNGDKSLKLGFDSRKDIRKYLTCYICLEDNEKTRKRIEAHIHKTYGYYFGDKQTYISKKVDDKEIIKRLKELK